MVVLPLREEGSVCPTDTSQRRVLPRLRSLLQRAKDKGGKDDGARSVAGPSVAVSSFPSSYDIDPRAYLLDVERYLEGSLARANAEAFNTEFKIGYRDAWNALTARDTPEPADPNPIPRISLRRNR